MKQIAQYINEKYLIDADTKSNYIDVDKYEKEIDTIYSIIMNNNQFPLYIDTLKAYKRQNISMEKSIESYKENKLICSWYAAIILEWNDAIETIAKEIDFRKIFDIEALHAFIIERYETLKFDSTWKHRYKNYAKIYNIDL